MNVSYPEIIGEYKAKHAELTYTTICQQLAIKKLEARVAELEAELEDAKSQEEAQRRHSQELQELLDEKNSDL